MPKINKQRKPKGITPTPADNISDPRFENIQSDPRFRLPSKRNTHVEIDSRFAHMLEDEAFSSRAKVDRYGRKLPKGKGKKDLQNYYRIADEKVEGRGPAVAGEEIDDDAVERELERLGGEDEDFEDNEIEDEGSRSSSEDDDDDVDLHKEQDEEVFGILEEGAEDGQGIPKGEISSRLAVVNLDWDNIRANDLMAVFQSFVPAGGEISNIAIYPSEFGKERMEREEMEGPPREIFAQNREPVAATASANIDGDASDISDPGDAGPDQDDNDEQIKQSILKEDTGAEFSSAHLRRYQLSRLRYYYAVLTCSTPSVASAVYDAVDGTEYLTTANFFDLRFIPDETGFDDDRPRDECSRLPDGYRPNEFVTEALQHSKVKLTWDADDGTRKEVQKRAFGGSRRDVDDNNLRAYLGSDSENDEEEDNNGNDELAAVVVNATVAANTNQDAAVPAPTSTSRLRDPKLSKKEVERQRMRSLLGLSAEPTARKPKSDREAPVGDVQVTFESGFSTVTDGSKKRSSVFENEPERAESTVEKYVRREKERKARRKEKMKSNRTNGGAAANDDDENENNSYDNEDGKPKSYFPSSSANREEDLTREDLGFADPFFTTTTTTEKITSTPNPSKTSNPSKKRQRREAADHGEEEDDFQVDVRDPRFNDVFSRAEFSIDPTHPRFSGSGGMKALLEEGRRVRGVDTEEEGGGGRGDRNRKEEERKKKKKEKKIMKKERKTYGN